MRKRQGFTVLHLMVGLSVVSLTLIYLSGGLAQFINSSQLMSASAEAKQNLRDLKRVLTRDFSRAYVKKESDTAEPVETAPSSIYGTESGCIGLKITSRTEGGELLVTTYTTRCVDSDQTSATQLFFPCVTQGKRPLVLTEREAANGARNVTQISNVYLCITLDPADTRSVAVNSGAYHSVGHSVSRTHSENYVLHRSPMENVDYH